MRSDRTDKGTCGVTRYDGRLFTRFTTADGLAHNTVMAMLQDRNGDLWFRTACGVSKYSNGKFANLTAEAIVFPEKIFLFEQYE